MENGILSGGGKGVSNALILYTFPFTRVFLNSYISAITEFITGREVDLCNDDELKGTEGYSTGEAKENMGVARMDIYSSELACERDRQAFG